MLTHGKSIYRRSQKKQDKQTMISDHFCVQTPVPPGPPIVGYSPHRQWALMEMLNADLVERSTNPAWWWGRKIAAIKALPEESKAENGAPSQSEEQC